MASPTCAAMRVPSKAYGKLDHTFSNACRYVPIIMKSRGDLEVKASPPKCPAIGDQVYCCSSK